MFSGAKPTRRGSNKQRISRGENVKLCRRDSDCGHVSRITESVHVRMERDTVNLIVRSASV